ncbi:MAG: GFA family protein [Rhizobiaceae bacterium]
MSKTHTGQCSCGSVRITTRGALRPVIYCHCTQCRRQTGHFLASSACEDSEFDVEGKDNITWFQSSADASRGFCAICGSGLFWKNKTKSYTSIYAGLFDEPNMLVAQSHIFVGDKGCYYEITDGLPQYETAPGGLVTAKATQS